MHEITQQININVLDAPAPPTTGGAVISQIGNFVAQNSVSIACSITVIALLILVFLLFRKRTPRLATKIKYSTIAITILLFSVLTFQLVNPAKAGTGLTLGSDTLNVTITKPTLSTTATDVVLIPSDVARHDYVAILDDITDDRITIELNGETVPDIGALIAQKSSDSSHDLNYTISIDPSLPVGNYTAYIIHSVEDKSEFFEFSIDTRMTDTLDTNPTHFDGTATSFSIPTSGLSGSAPTYSWIIDWGDGTPEQTVSGSSTPTSAGIGHDYASTGGPGEYQITIYSNGIAYNGWMDAFGFSNGVSGASIQSNKNMFKSIDSPITNDMRTSGISARYANMFYGARNAVGIPSGLFDAVYTTDSVATMSSMFNSTFYGYAYNSTTASIPAGLFSSIDTSTTYDTQNMFLGTFGQFAYNSTAGTIPDDLFSSLDTSNVALMNNMFNSTFYTYGYGSTVPTTATIPLGLFDTIDTSSADWTVGMFSNTFNGFAYTSTIATIPAGLFSTINTSSSQYTNNMFNSTFWDYGRFSPVMTIGANLFSSLDTSNSLNTSGMFAQTFFNCGYNSTVGTIPNNLFTGVDLSSSTNVSNMFASTFYSYARVNNSVLTDINTIWGSANFAGQITAANADNVFSSTFYNMTPLSGTAQTFIDTKLGVGLIPATRAQTFVNTQVTDLTVLDPNWK